MHYAVSCMICYCFTIIMKFVDIESCEVVSQTLLTNTVCDKVKILCKGFPIPNFFTKESNICIMCGKNIESVSNPLKVGFHTAEAELTLSLKCRLLKSHKLYRLTHNCTPLKINIV